MIIRKDVLLKKDNILNWILEKKSKSFIKKELECDTSTLEKVLKFWNIEYKGCQDWSKDLEIKPIEFYLKKGSLINSDVLKKKLFKSGIKEKRCENIICLRTEWNGLDIPLQLHHKDGDKYNNELTNLEILCSNCHSQTDNYCKNRMIKKKKYCHCGKQISKIGIECKSCSKLKQKRKIPNRPSLQTLLDDIKECSYLEVGRKYNVSDNCIRKWFKYYGVIPPTKNRNNDKQGNRSNGF
jgi:hypothetical protein